MIEIYTSIHFYILAVNSEKSLRQTEQYGLTKILLSHYIEGERIHNPMLKIVFGDVKNSIYHPPTYFDNVYMDEWITDPLSADIIKDIDKSKVLDAHIIDSPFLGSISVKNLSGSVKTLMLMKFDESGKIFNASACGDDCAKWIVKISQEKDLTINLHHIMDFSEADEFKAYIENTGKMVYSNNEYVSEAFAIEDK